MIRTIIESIDTHDEYKLPDNFLTEFYELVEAITDNSQSPKCLGNCKAECCHNAGCTREEFEYLKPHITSVNNYGDDKCYLSDPETGKCTVYKYRPLECRVFDVIDKVIMTNCPCEQEVVLGDKYTAIREALYRYLYTAIPNEIEFKPLIEFIKQEGLLE